MQLSTIADTLLYATTQYKTSELLANTRVGYDLNRSWQFLDQQV